MPEGEDARGQRLINSISSGGVVLHPSAESVSKVSGTSSRCARQFLSRLRYQPSTLSGARERTFLKLTAFSRLYLDSKTCFIQGRFGHCFAGPSPASRLARPCATIANVTVVKKERQIIQVWCISTTVVKHITFNSRVRASFTCPIPLRLFWKSISISEASR